MSLTRRTAANIRYNASAKAVALGFQAAATIILSRNLTSADYGVVAFAFIFVRFLSQFNDFGMQSATVQAQELDEEALLTAFWIKSFLGVGLFSAAMVAAPIAGSLFDNKATVDVVRLLSLHFLLGPLGFIPTALLTRALDYRTLAIAEMCSTIINASVAIALAISGFGYWSIVFGHLASTGALVLATNALRPHKITYRFAVPHARRFLRYGSPLLVSTLVIFALLNADNFLIGITHGATMLGYYTLAFTWGSAITTLIGSVVNTVLFPTFSRMQDDRPRLRAAYLRSLHYVSVVGIVANTTLLLVVPEFLVHVLGHGTGKWLPALNALRLLCVYGIVRVILEPLASVIMAVGKVGVLLKANVIAALLELALLYPALTYLGIDGAAAAVTVAYAVQYAVYYPFVRKELNIYWRDVLWVVGPAALPLLVAVPACLLYGYAGTENTKLALIAKSVIFAVCYVMTYGIVTRWRILRDIRTMFGPASGESARA